MAVIVLKKNFDKRDNIDIKILMHLTKDIKFFRDMLNIDNPEAERIHESCCKFLNYESY